MCWIALYFIESQKSFATEFQSWRFISLTIHHYFLTIQYLSTHILYVSANNKLANLVYWNCHSKCYIHLLKAESWELSWYNTTSLYPFIVHWLYPCNSCILSKIFIRLNNFVSWLMLSASLNYYYSRLLRSAWFPNNISHWLVIKYHY